MKRILSALALSLLSAAPAVAQQPQSMVMEPVVVRDPLVGNMVAFSFLKPQGWQSTGALHFNKDLYQQVWYEGKVARPGSLEQLESLKWVTCVWTDGVPARPLTNYLGNIVLPPLAPKDVIARYTLPLERKGLNPRIVANKDMPDVAEFFARKVGIRVLATRTRVEYRLNGRPVEEDFYLILGYKSGNIGFGNTTWWWPVVPPFALRAAKGELDAATPQMLAMAHSVWINPAWTDQVEHAQSLFLQRMGNASANAVKLSFHLSANNDSIRNMIRESYEYRQRVVDRAHQKFSDYIRGVQVYTGAGRSVQLPSGYDHVWYGSNGNYVLSNQPGFNPNQGSRFTWTRMQPVTR